MQIVDLQLPRHQLSAQMAAMRIWLDEHRLEPTSFVCNDAREEVRVVVTFTLAGEARAFADRFAGRVHAAPAAVASGLEPTDLVG
jgi:hypothetical protein